MVLVGGEDRARGALRSQSCSGIRPAHTTAVCRECSVSVGRVSAMVVRSVV